jgi:hypothetical protein
MNTGKKLSWQLAVVTAATLLSGSVPAASRAHDKAWREQAASKLHKASARMFENRQGFASDISGAESVH